MSNLSECTICQIAPMDKAQYLTHLMGKKHKKNARSRNLSNDKTINKRSLLITSNRDLNPHIFPIIRKYLQYDVKDVAIRERSAVVEFPSERMATMALEDKLEIAEVFLKVERVKLDLSLKKNLSLEKTHIKAPDISKNLCLLLKALQCPLSPDELILHLVNEIELKPKDYKSREEIRFLVQSYLQPAFPGAVTFLFGSSVNNLGFKGCDVDMVANIGYNCWEGNNKGEAEKEAEKLTRYIANQLRKSKFAYNVIAIGRARVPIVKFNCHIGGMQVDLSFKNGLPVYNTDLIKLYTSCHGIVRPYLMLIRYWAKLQGLSGGGKPRLLLTNYCLCMISLFCLMIRRPPIVPCVGELQEGLSDYVIIDDCVCSFKQDVELWKRRYHNTTIVEIALEFFQFYRDLDFDKYVISPLAGTLVPKDDIRRHRPSFSQTYLLNFYKRKLTLQLDTALCVQDPFDVTHNIARGYSSDALNYFRKKCDIAAKVCRDIILRKKTLDTLFEYYEINQDIFDYDSSSEKKNNVADSDVVSVCSDDSVELLQELESLERSGGVKGLLQKGDRKSSEDSGCEVNGSSESVAQTVSVEQKNTQNDEEITFIKKITPEIRQASVEIVELEDSDENDLKKTSKKVGNENGNSAKPESLNESVVECSDNSVSEVEEIVSQVSSINPAEERYSFTIKYYSTCSYDIQENGCLRPRKRGHLTSSSKHKFVSDLLHFILKQVMKCNVKVETFIEIDEENNKKNTKKRSIEENNPPQKFLKTNSEEGKVIKSDFALLSSFECQPLFRVWERRKEFRKEFLNEKSFIEKNPLQIDMFLSSKIAEIDTLEASGIKINVNLWKDNTNVDVFWVSLRLNSDEDKNKKFIDEFKHLFSNVTLNIFSRIDEFIKWT